jgi:hypothetical protein
VSEERDLEEERWQVRWAAEVSSRYHRRRATWLNNVDFLLNLIQMVSATAAFVDLTRGTSGHLAAAGTLLIAICALLQIVGRLGKAATDHELLMRQWCELLAEVETTDASPTVIKRWLLRKGELNKLHVGELRAVAVAAENEAASALGVPDRQRHIGRLQWLLMHVVTIQRKFLHSPDFNPAAPSKAG